MTQVMTQVRTQVRTQVTTQVRTQVRTQEPGRWMDPKGQILFVIGKNPLLTLSPYGEKRIWSLWRGSNDDSNDDSSDTQVMTQVKTQVK